MGKPEKKKIDIRESREYRNVYSDWAFLTTLGEKNDLHIQATFIWTSFIPDFEEATLTQDGDVFNVSNAEYDKELKRIKEVSVTMTPRKAFDLGRIIFQRISEMSEDEKVAFDIPVFTYDWKERGGNNG